MAFPRPPPLHFLRPVEVPGVTVTMGHPCDCGWGWHRSSRGYHRVENGTKIQDPSVEIETGRQKVATWEAMETCTNALSLPLSHPHEFIEFKPALSRGSLAANEGHGDTGIKGRKIARCTVTMWLRHESRKRPIDRSIDRSLAEEDNKGTW